MRIICCKVNHLINPMGYEMRRTVFSWLVEEAIGKKQSAARIVVSLHADLHAPVTDTGFTDLNSIAADVPVQLMPRTRYYWQVTVRSDANEEASSDIQWFETGKMGEAWTAKWITCEKQARHPVFRKQIMPGKNVVKARLYISGLGVYEAAVNGKRVDNEYLTPYCNNYNAWIQYQTYDVTEQLQNGGELTVTLGHGWYSGRFGFFSKPGGPGDYGQEDRLIAEIHLSYADGTEQIIATDESWQVTRSNITDSSIYDGETRDDTLTDTEPEAVSIMEAPIPVARYSLPVTVHEQLKPIQLIRTPIDETVLDLGQNLTGIFDLRVHGVPAGGKVHIQMGEVMQEGCFYNENLRSALAEYWYVSDGTDRVIRPHFTFYGFRYVKIEGIPELTADDFTALALYSDLPETGCLVTGHAKLNRLIKNVEWGLKDNFLDVPTDCPQRDERMGWTGDAQAFSATACYLRDCYAFYRKFLHDMETEQREHDGMVTDVVPSFANAAYKGTACVWGDAVTIIPWNVYQYYGDISILEDCFDQMKAWVDYIRRVDGDHQGWKKVFHYGDWLALDHPNRKPDQCLGGTDVGYIAYVYYMRSAEIVAESAGLLGKAAEALEYRQLAQKLRDSIVHDYFAPSGLCCVDTQTGLLLALKHHLTPDPAVAAARLQQKLKDNDGYLQTGFVGTPFLCKELSDHGAADMAWNLMLNEDYPGWLYEVNLGGTTIWERWNSMNPDGSVSSTGMNSFNHYAYGSIAEWLYGDAAGLRMGTAGFRHAVIVPNPTPRIGFADLRYQSAAGVWQVKWDAPDKKHLHMSITVPFGCTAEVTLPFMDQAPIMLDAGAYEYDYAAVRPIGKVWTLDDRLIDMLIDKQAKAVLAQYAPESIDLPYSMQLNSISALIHDLNVVHLDAEQAATLASALATID